MSLRNREREITTHKWDFDAALTIPQFYAEHEVSDEDAQYLIKKVQGKNGTFLALGLTNGELVLDAKNKPVKRNGETIPAMTFFALSDTLVDNGEELSEEFLDKHAEDILLLEPIDGLKFGTIFFAGNGGKKNWFENHG